MIVMMESSLVMFLQSRDDSKLHWFLVGMEMRLSIWRTFPGYQDSMMQFIYLKKSKYILSDIFLDILKYNISEIENYHF